MDLVILNGHSHPPPVRNKKARAAAAEEREAAVDAARSKLTLEEQELFDGGLASCRAANFPWWQDDHNYYIDLRVSLPVRGACHAIADRVGAGHPDDTLCLFWEEIMAVSSARRSYARLRGLVEERKLTGGPGSRWVVRLLHRLRPGESRGR